jgi:GDP-L-fucose synthase
MKNSKIYLAGHNGMVGKAVFKKLFDSGYENILVSNKEEVDLRRQESVENFIYFNRPDIVIIAAARVGGILANMNYPAEFLYDNAMIELNIIHAAYKYDVRKLVFISSSCSYPKDSKLPIKESNLTNGYFESTNEPLAIAKVLGVKMTEYYSRQFGSNFISLMPTNLYGPHDYFHLKNGHVLPALMRRFHEAVLNSEEVIEVWGTGNPLREFMYVEDFADAVLFMLENYCDFEHVNIGTGVETSIRDLSQMLKQLTGFKGEIIFNDKYPDGMYRKVLDISKASSKGWNYSTSLYEGLKKTYDWFKEVYPNVRGI